MSASATNPCLSCGACCAHYRCSFYWGETDEVRPGGVPVHMTEPIGPFRAAMRGMSGSQPRCIALAGVVGVSAFCSIYEQRPSVCQNFEPSWKMGTANPLCDKARAVWGLPPLTPETWQDPHLPKAA
ncbi:MAG: YkgJ family cysteine cluster protein [Deltaproteobacteria bacterium]|nr:YkgJ family cysteine cluster protein [Deltaproteobacteria bacterium]